MTEIQESLAAQAGLINELAMTAIEPTMRGEGLTPPMFGLLSAVKSAGPKAHQAELARRLGITPPTLTSAIQRAGAAGFLEQEAGKRDARTKVVKITPKGHAALRKVLRAVAELDVMMLKGIDSGDLATALDVLRKASMNLAVATSE